MKIFKVLNFKKILLIFILTVAVFLRAWDLGNVPPSVSLDEASIGYNAYSVLNTGVDEYGDFPIISQRGYDDWRRSTYLFLTIPFVKLFGLTAIAVRLPAVILSILTVWASYHIVLLLLEKWSKFSEHIALLTSFFLAISPWHIYISRLGHESNAYLSFFIFGLLLFLQGLKKDKVIFVFASMIFFLLSMVSYYSGQVFIPLFILGLLLVFRVNLLSIFLLNKKNFIYVIILIVLSILVLVSVFSPEALIRYKGTTALTPEAHPSEFAKRVELRNKAVENKDLIQIIYYNRRFFPIQIFIEGYISHFDPQWLFTNSGNESFKIPSLGLLYAWQLPFIILGIVTLIIDRDISLKYKTLIFLWFILSVVPASIATQAPHAMRSYMFVSVWQIFTALGLFYLFYKFRNVKLLITPFFLLIVLFSLSSLLKNYFVDFPKEQSRSFQYGLTQAIPYILSIQKKYDRIVVSNEDNLYQSYMFFLFHSRFDPELYKNGGGTESGGFAATHKIGKYEFRPIELKNEKQRKKTLYVGNPSDFPNNIKKIKEFKNLDGNIDILIVAI